MPYVDTAGDFNRAATDLETGTLSEEISRFLTGTLEVCTDAGRRVVSESLIPFFVSELGTADRMHVKICLVRFRIG